MVATTSDHQAACHHADEALKTDVGIAHIGVAMVRRGTPASAIASLETDPLTQEAPLATPAFAETPESAGKTAAADTFGVEAPDSTDTPTDIQNPF